MKALISNRWRRMIAVPLSVLLMGAGLLFSTTASAQIAGTAHDFSDGVGGAGSDAWNTTGEICVVCHAPHNAYEIGEGGGSGTRGPLWNRSLSAVNNYSVYSSANRVGSFLETSTTGSQTADPSGVSKLCLSCHDGTIALDSFGRTDTGAVEPGNAGNTIAILRPNANIGEGGAPGPNDGDLSDDHPVAFTFPTTDTEIFTFSGGFVDGPNPGILPLFGAGDQMECATCHDVHGTGNDNLLRVDNAGSGLCLSCHDK